MRELREIATKKPTLTLKAQNSVLAHEQEIILPRNSKWVEHEAELGIVIGKGGYRIKNPGEYILGYTIVNDITARDIEKEMIQWSASKSFPTFCPVGPCIETDLDPSNLKIKCWVNKELRQDSRDLIATGTVPGTGPLQNGDVIEIKIEGIGVLRNYVKGGKL
ncbi:MAG: hypothetical protein B6U86_04645 [Candidatus Altiarchaeales archaeon ex4484_43]|nr:MAG: hypothetical protein B6U86_04645 [Candidatus Altiarchaeales archaeon ex4484_43]